MRSGNAIESLHHALAHAMYAGFSDIEYEDRDWKQWSKTKEDVRVKKTRRPSSNDIEVYAMFLQTWGSTALGFSGIGGQAMTAAYTVVLECQGEHAVYFGGRFAYKINRVNPRFFDDVQNHRVANVREAKARYETESKPSEKAK